MASFGLGAPPAPAPAAACMGIRAEAESRGAAEGGRTGWEQNEMEGAELLLLNSVFLAT